MLSCNSQISTCFHKSNLKLKMKVICSGMPKTGTKTMATALRELGYNVYDFEEQFHYLGKDLLRILDKGWTIEEIRRIYKDADAITDVPGSLLFEEILQAYPDAKVIHTERSSEEQWLDSLVLQANSRKDNIKYRLTTLITPTGNRLRRFINAAIKLGRSCNEDGILYHPPLNKQIANLRYRQHNTRVREAVPKGQLLLFNIKDGWEPLCKFLGKPVPDKEFPHRNKGASITKEIVETSYIFDPIKREFLIAGAGIFAAVAFVFYNFVFKNLQ